MQVLRNLILLTFGLLAGGAAMAQSSEDQAAKAITATYALGEVVTNDVPNGRMVLKTAAGDINVNFGEKTQFLQLPPGEKTLDKAVAVSSSDVQTGDRVLARGKVSDDRKSLPARQIVVMTKAAISEKQAREKAEWEKRGIAGTITAVAPASREVTVRVSTPTGPQTVTVHAGEKTAFRRYAPDSVKFADALSSLFDQLKVGDQLRTLGNKDEAGTRVEAEMVVSGSFVMAGGPVTAVDAQNGTVTIRNLITKKPLIIVVNKDSMVRRIPEQFAMMLARRAQMMNGGGAPGSLAGQRGAGTWQGQGRGSGSSEGARPEGQSGTPSQPAGGQTSTGGPAGQSAMGGTGERPSGAGGAGRGGFGPGAGAPGGAMRSGDLSELFQRLPAMNLADLTVGELILVSSTVGSDPSQVTAIQLAAGVEPLLTEPATGSEGQSFTFPSGVFDVGMSMP